MTISRIKFTENPFNIGWKKSERVLSTSCLLGEISYDDSDDKVLHTMDSSDLDEICPTTNSSKHAFGKYNLMYPSDTNKLIVEESASLNNGSESNVFHSHYFFANTEIIDKLETAYFFRVKNNNKIVFGKMENGAETIFKEFTNFIVPNYRRLEITYSFDGSEANFRLVVEDSAGNRLLDNRFTDSNPIENLQPNNADPGYLNAVHYENITNPNNSQFTSGSETYNYEIYQIVVVEERLQIVQDLRRTGRFYVKNGGLAINLSWTNILENLDAVVVQRKKDTFPRDHNNGTTVYSNNSPISNEEITISDSPLQKDTSYFYAVFSKFFGSWNDAVRKDKNATIVDTSEIPPIEIIDDFRASDGESIKSALSWSNPDDNQLGLVRVVRKQGGFPDDHEDGEIVFEKTDPQPDNLIEHIDKGLRRNEFYYYAVFTRRTAGEVWNDKVIFSE